MSTQREVFLWKVAPIVPAIPYPPRCLCSRCCKKFASTGRYKTQMQDGRLHLRFQSLFLLTVLDFDHSDDTPSHADCRLPVRVSYPIPLWMGLDRGCLHPIQSQKLYKDHPKACWYNLDYPSFLGESDALIQLEYAHKAYASPDPQCS